MSANVDQQRSKGQPSQVSNGNGKDLMKEENPYLQQTPHHQMRSWSDQASDGAYGAAPMATSGVSESFFQGYYTPSMSYPFMSQGIGSSEGPWSQAPSADTMFSMGYDYTNLYGGFGFPFNNWEYSSEYWSNSQPVRKDQRGYAAEDPYYPPEMIPTDSYGMINGTAPPPEPQEPIGSVEQGVKNMSLAPSMSNVVDTHVRKKMDMAQTPVMADSFGGGSDQSLIMSPPAQSSSTALMSSSSSGGIQGQSKKTSWAAIASQPARPQQQMRPRTIPRAPVHPNKPHSMDIGTWDGRGNPAKAPVPIAQIPPAQPIQPRQSWATNSARSRQIQPQPPSLTGTVASVPASSGNSNSNLNSNSSNGNTTSSSSNNNNNNSMGASQNIPSSSISTSYSSNSGSVPASRNSVASSAATTNGSHGDSQATQRVTPHPILDQLRSSNIYNPKEFTLNQKSARFFVIKSYSEDDIHRSIKYSIWCSTEHGNKRLDQAFREREGKGPVYLIYSVNGSGHFCGIAQMMSPVDYSRSAGVWAQDKWKGQFEVRWIYVKDVPNHQLRHIRLENNENKPVTNSRDTQEVPPEKGKQVLRILHSYKNTTSIFDDFTHYEKRQEEDQHQTPQHTVQRDNRGGGSGGGDRGGGSGGGDRGGDRGDRDHHNHHRNDYNRGGDSHHRNDRNDHYRSDMRGDHRDNHRGDGGRDRAERGEPPHRGGFDRVDHRGDDGSGRNQRDNRRGGRQN